MLLIVADHDVNERAPWIATNIGNEVDDLLDDVAFALDKVDLGLLAGKSAVATMFANADDRDLVRAVAAAARVVLVTSSPEAMCERLGLRSGADPQAIRLGVFLVSSDKPEKIKEKELRAEYGADWVKVLWENETRAGYWTIGKRSRWFEEGASDSHRLDPGDRKVRRETAAAAAAEVFQELLETTEVEEYQIRGVEAMYILHSDGAMEVTDSPFDDYDELTDAVKFLASYGGDDSKRFDKLSPKLDIQIAGHWRLHAEAYVTNPPHIVLRYNRGKMPLESLSVADWRMTAILREAIAGKVRANLVITATMGGGKTTLCQTLLAEVPEFERIDTIEDTPELRLSSYGIHANTYERLTRDANNEGIGEHSMEDHIRDAKRSNTRKLVVGETRGPGTLAMLDAMTSGLDGCVVTIHSRPGAAVIEKLTAYAQMDGAEPAFARRQIANSVHLMVWLTRNERNQRVVGDLSQLIGIDEETSLVKVRTLWRWEPGSRWAKPAGAHPPGRMGEVYLAAGVYIDPDNPEMEEKPWERSMIGKKAVVPEGMRLSEDDMSDVSLATRDQPIRTAARVAGVSATEATSPGGPPRADPPEPRTLQPAARVAEVSAPRPAAASAGPARRPGSTPPPRPARPGRRPVSPIRRSDSTPFALGGKTTRKSRSGPTGPETAGTPTSPRRASGPTQGTPLDKLDPGKTRPWNAVVVWRPPNEAAGKKRAASSKTARRPAGPARRRPPRQAAPRRKPASAPSASARKPNQAKVSTKRIGPKPPAKKTDDRESMAG